VTRRAILHVGPHKTATTYLQYRLLGAGAQLAAAGFTYPELGLDQFAHHLLCDFVRAPTRAGSGLQEEPLRAALARCENVVLSSENFIYATEAELGFLRGLLEGFRMEVVLMVRHPAGLWPSHWQELVKHGRDLTFLDYAAGCCGWTEAVPAASVNPLEQARKFARVFGRDAIRAACFDNLLARGEDLFDWFWRRVLGIASDPPPYRLGRLNPSMPVIRVELLRTLNQLYRAETGEDPGERILQAYHARQDGIEASPGFAQFAAAFHGNATEIVLDGAQELFAQRDRAFMAEFGDRLDNAAGPDALYLAPMQSRTPCADRHWAQASGMGGFVQHVLADLLGTPAPAPPPVHCVLDRVEGAEIFGWAIDEANPLRPVRLAALIDGAAAGECICDLVRPDVLEAGYASARVGFRLRLALPAAGRLELRDGGGAPIVFFWGTERRTALDLVVPQPAG
jgi:hypothetical protein